MYQLCSCGGGGVSRGHRRLNCIAVGLFRGGNLGRCLGPVNCWQICRALASGNRLLGCMGERLGICYGHGPGDGLKCGFTADIACI